MRPDCTGERARVETAAGRRADCSSPKSFSSSAKGAKDSDSASGEWPGLTSEARWTSSFFASSEFGGDCGFGFFRVFSVDFSTVLGRAVRSGLIGCQFFPPLAVGENHLRAKIQKARILRRENERRHIGGAVFRAAHEDVRELASGAVEADDAAVPATGINDVRIQRIGRDVAVFEIRRRKTSRDR